MKNKSLLNYTYRNVVFLSRNYASFVFYRLGTSCFSFYTKQPKATL